MKKDAKPTWMIRVSIRLPEDTFDAASEKAIRLGGNFSSYVRQLIEADLAKNEPKRMLR